MNMFHKYLIHPRLSRQIETSSVGNNPVLDARILTRNTTRMNVSVSVTGVPQILATGVNAVAADSPD